MSIFNKSSAFKKNVRTATENDNSIIGDNLNFEGTEAFNLLRTNLFFSFADDKKCHIIGITSPMPGSGKSVCAANLAHSIAKAGQKALLIDGDLRLPTIGKKMNLKSEKGLSHVLVGKESPRDVLVHVNDYLDVLLSGVVPPKPSELLGSARMNEVFRELEGDYEYIIVDLPPVEVVSDALVISKYLDGMIVIVHKDVCEKNALDDTLRKLNMANAKILGLVFKEDWSVSEEVKKKSK